MLSIGSRIRFGSNWLNNIRFGTNTKGHLLNISTAIDPSAFKEIGIRNMELFNSFIEIKNRNRIFYN
jgi:hypothetical protein